MPEWLQLRLDRWCNLTVTQRNENLGATNRFYRVKSTDFNLTVRISGTDLDKIITIDFRLGHSVLILAPVSESHQKIHFASNILKLSPLVCHQHNCSLNKT